LVGGDPKIAARRALPTPMRRGAVVEEEDDGGGGIEVKVPVPTLLPRLPVGRVTARSGLGGNDE
jgi:hypothetical protein